MRSLLVVWIAACVLLFAMAAGSSPLRGIEPAQVAGATPALLVSPATSVVTRENVPVTFELEVQNPAGSAYVFSVSPDIRNAELDTEAGIWRFHPDFIQAATYNLEFSADSEVDQVTATARVRVENSNRPPDVVISFGNRLVIDEGSTTRIQMFAIDPDPGDTLVYSVTPAVDNLVVDATTGSVTFSPDFFQSGIYDLDFIVDDGHNPVINPRLIEVRNINRAPRIILNPLEPQTLQVGETLNLLATISDPDREPLEITLDGAPENSTFNPSTGRFTFTPTLENFRQTYTLIVSAGDGTVTSRAQTTISVTADIDPLYEFSVDGNFEGWTANEQIRGATVRDGFLSGESINMDPILTRTGLSIDSVAQRELVLRIFTNPPSPVDLFFISREGRFFGPLTISNIDPNVFTTVSADFTTLFDEPQVIQSIRIDPLIRPGSFIIDYIGLNRTGIPTRTPAPIPSATPRPTSTPTPTSTPSPTPMPTSTPSPLPDPPTPTPTPRFVVSQDFEDPNAVFGNFEVLPLDGIEPATVRQTSVQNGDRLSGGVMEIIAEPGEGVLILSRDTYTAETGTPLLSVDTILDSTDVTLALLSCNAPYDGQFGYMIGFPGALPTATEETLHLSYTPPSGQYRIGMQVVQAATATTPATVRFDNLAVERIISPFLSPLPLVPDGSLDGDLDSLLFNINSDEGTVQEVREDDQNVRLDLAVNRVLIAANVGLMASLVPEQRFDLLTAAVEVQRRAGMDGRVDYVLTDGFSAFGQSALGSRFSLGDDPFTLQIGGQLLPTAPFRQPVLVMQLAGTGTNSAIRIDDLQLFATIPEDE